MLKMSYSRGAPDRKPKPSNHAGPRLMRGIDAGLMGALMSNTNTVYNATTGVCLLDGVTDAQYDRWYDGHSQFRKVRDIHEVNPEFRDLYEAINDRPGVEWLVEDWA
jgi:hypothetical protein